MPKHKLSKFERYQQRRRLRFAGEMLAIFCVIAACIAAWHGYTNEAIGASVGFLLGGLSMYWVAKGTIEG